MGYLDNRGLEHYSWLVRNKLAKNRQMTKSAGAVAFCPAPETELESVVDFMFTETLPAEGEKGPENPSTITGVSSVGVGVHGKNLFRYVQTGTYAQVSISVDTDGAITLNGTCNAAAGVSVYVNDNTYYTPYIPVSTQKYLVAKIEHISGSYTGETSSNQILGVELINRNLKNNTVGYEWIQILSTDGDTAIKTWNYPLFNLVNNAYTGAVLILFGGVSYNNYKIRVQYEFSDTLTPSNYESPIISPYTLSLSDTYYGGSLDVATGVMTVTWVGGAIPIKYVAAHSNGIVSFAWNYNGDYKFPGAAKTSTDITCTNFQNNVDADNTTERISLSGNNDGTSWGGVLAISESRIGGSGLTNAQYLTNAQEYLLNNSVVFAAKIWTPFIVQLTPTQIRSLPALDKYTPRINTVYTDQQSVRVGWIREDIAPTVWVKDMLRAEIEAVSGGRNTVVRDQWDNPHTMVVVPKFRLSDIDSSWSSDVHPAFIVNGAEKSEILIGKYLASKSSANRAQTLPRQAPWTQINFDSSLAECRALGTGFCLVTNAMWSARVLWDYKTLGGSHEYLGNRNYGRDSTYHELTGTLKSGTYTPGDTSLQDAATLTGTGGEKWTDDETAWGIADLVGNVWEWTAGLRLVDGEIQILPNNDASLAAADLSATSTEWKAILEDGTLVAPGTANTLKYDGDAADTRTSGGAAGSFSLNDALTNQNVNGYYSIDFKNLAAVSGVTVPAILKQLAIFPVGNDVQGHMFMCNKGERLAHRGGSWGHGAHAGPVALSLSDARSNSYRSIGFRAAFVA